MQPTLHLTTRVLAGSKIEITSPALTEGDSVDIYLVVRQEPSGSTTARKSVLDIIESLPTGPRSASTWEQVDREWNAERDAWE